MSPDYSVTYVAGPYPEASPAQRLRRRPHLRYPAVPLSTDSLMERRGVSFPRDLRWRREAQWRNGEIPARWRDWLFDRASLTRRLQRLYRSPVRVRLVSQGPGRPLRWERSALGLRPGCRCLIRRVYLTCGGAPRVYARTVVPPASLKGPTRRLKRAGGRPLGEWLFSGACTDRGVLEAACVRPTDELYREIGSGASFAPIHLWGRRSVFRVRGRALLVSEFFLPLPPAG